MSGRSFVVDKLGTAESDDSAPGSYTRRNVRISWAPWTKCRWIGARCVALGTVMCLMFELVSV